MRFKLFDSFYNNPHHLGDGLLVYDDLFVYTILLQKTRHYGRHNVIYGNTHMITR